MTITCHQEGMRLERGSLVSMETNGERWPLDNRSGEEQVALEKGLKGSGKCGVRK
jgi:hypothetical protein